MVEFKKEPTQGEEEPTGKYQPPNIKLNMNLNLKASEDDKPVEYEPYILNLDKELIKSIETFISDKKNEGVRLYDLKTKKNKKINKSLWARKVLVAALEEEGYLKKQ